MSDKDEPEQEQPQQEESDAPTTSGDSQQSGGRSTSVAKKAIFAGVCLIIFFGLLEFVLAMAGVPRLRDQFDTSYGMSPHEPLFEQNGDVFQTRSSKLAYFQEQTFDVEKKDNTYRIFFLGGSTTFGRPYGDAESYVGILRKSLQDNAPEKNWELVNCGGVSYASYRLSVLANELKRYSPDLFVVYTGHNEFLEERTFRDVKNRWNSVNLILRPVTYLRTASLFNFTGGKNEDPLLEQEVTTILDNSIGPKDYERDPKLKTNVVKQYRQSLNEILQHANDCGAKVIFIDPADNLQFSPFKSQHGDVSDQVKESIKATLAKSRNVDGNQLGSFVSEMLQARELDPLFANIHFVLADTLLKLKQFDAAFESFMAARETDVCPLRANQDIHLELKAFSKEHELPVIPYAEILDSQNQRMVGNPIRGHNLFFDHVHPRTEMHGVLAGYLLLELNKLGELSDNGLEKCKLNFAGTMKQTINALGKGDHAKALSNLSQVLSWSGKNAEALALAKEADGMAPKDVWIKCQYGRMLEKSGDVDAAEKVYAAAVILNPRDPLATFRLARIAYGKDRIQEALQLLEISQSMTPEGAPQSFRDDVQNLINQCKQKQ